MAVTHLLRVFPLPLWTLSQPIGQLLHPPNYHPQQFSCWLFHSINYYGIKNLLILPCRNVKVLFLLFSISKESQEKSGRRCHTLQCSDFLPVVETKEDFFSIHPAATECFPSSYTKKISPAGQKVKLVLASTKHHFRG